MGDWYPSGDPPGQVPNLRYVQYVKYTQYYNPDERRNELHFCPDVVLWSVSAFMRSRTGRERLSSFETSSCPSRQVSRLLNG